MTKVYSFIFLSFTDGKPSCVFRGWSSARSLEDAIAQQAQHVERQITGVDHTQYCYAVDSRWKWVLALFTPFSFMSSPSSSNWLLWDGKAPKR